MGGSIAEPRARGALVLYKHEMAMTNRLGWGILGAARINEKMLPAILGARNAQLVAVASRRAGAAAQALGKWAPHAIGVSTYDSFEALLGDARVQAVYIPGSNREHAELALQVIESGRAALIEKPMALREEDIDAIEAAAKKRSVQVMEGFMYRFHPQHARIEELIRGGAIGPLRAASASYSFLMRPERADRVALPWQQGGGAMWDVGCYAVHTLRHLFAAEPVGVIARSHLAESGADLSTSGVLDFGGGRYGHFDASFERARGSTYTAHGTTGSATCETVWQLPGSADEAAICWWGEDGRRHREVLPAANHFQLEVEHFSDCVISGRQPGLSLDDARMNCRVITACLSSAN